MPKQYSVLQGLVRDLERAIEDGGTVAWKLLSRFDNALFAIEEVDMESTDASPDAGVDDESSELSEDDDAAEGPHEGHQQLALGGGSHRNDDRPQLRAGVASGGGRTTTPSAAVGVPTPAKRGPLTPRSVQQRERERRRRGA